MTKINLILLIIEIVLLLIFFSIIIYRYCKDKLNSILNRLNDSETECIDNLSKKYNYLLEMIKIIETKYKVESKVFEDAKKLNIDSINSFKDEKLLNKCYKEIIQIKEDNKKVKETKAFKELLDNYDKNEIRIISTRTYHNKYTLIYNNTIKKFPYNLISKCKKYKMKTLIEGKELDTNFNNDLEV